MLTLLQWCFALATDNVSLGDPISKLASVFVCVCLTFLIYYIFDLFIAINIKMDCPITSVVPNNSTGLKLDPGRWRI